ASVLRTGLAAALFPLLGASCAARLVSEKLALRAFAGWCRLAFRVFGVQLEIEHQNSGGWPPWGAPLARPGPPPPPPLPRLPPRLCAPIQTKGLSYADRDALIARLLGVAQRELARVPGEGQGESLPVDRADSRARSRRSRPLEHGFHPGIAAQIGVDYRPQ